MRTHEKIYDVIVAGGGPAGIGAALAAAKNGAKTLLVEHYGFLGGNITAGCVLNLRTYNNNAGKIIVGGIPLKFANRLLECGGAMLSPAQDPCVRVNPDEVKYQAQEMCLETGVELLLHSHIVGTCVEGNAVKGIFVENKSGKTFLRANVVADCTGDGDVFHHAGADYEKGSQDSELQPMTMAFVIGGVSTEGWPHVRTSERSKAFREACAIYGQPAPTKSFALFPCERPGEVYANVTRCFGDCTDAFDLTKAEIKGKRQVWRMIEFYRKHIPGFEKCYLARLPAQIGTRESRRLSGLLTLTEKDILNYQQFDDRILRGAYSIDIHSGKDDTNLMTHIEPGKSYTIPYRCLVPKSLDGLLAAGRCVSADRPALGAIRVMVLCMGMGEAAGAAAAMCADSKIHPRHLNVDKLKKQLINQGVILDE